MLKQLAGMFGYELVKKGEVKDKYNKSVKSSNFWDAWYALEEVLRKYNWATDSYEFITDETAVKEALTDFSDIMQNILLTPNIAKTLKQDFINKKQTEEPEMTKDEIKSLIDEAVEPIKKALEPKPAEPKPETEPITAEVIKKMISDAIKKSDEPPADADEPLTLESIQKMIDDAVTPVLKARGLASNLNDEPNVEKSVEPHYLAGIL